MIKKVLIFIIVFILFYEIYILYLENPNEYEYELKKNNSVEPSKITNDEQKFENNSFSYINNEIIEDKIDNHVELIKNVDPNMFGKPSQYEKNNLIVWIILDPKPWDKIIYKYNETYPFYFHIKIKVPSLNDYSNWKKIISNLDFNPTTGEIIIPTEDEETALSIANLLILNFKGEISLEDIISKNLIEISINKAKKYEVVKHKLIEQIMINLNEKPKETMNNTQTFTTDLAETQDTFAAYEGTEYSFF